VYSDFPTGQRNGGDMRELPRHEIEPKKVEPEYRAEQNELEQKRNLKNIGARWTGIRKVPLDPHDGSLPAKNAEFKATTAKLKTLTGFGGGTIGSHRADPRKLEAQKVRGDLAGYWNDAKHELASRLGTTGKPNLEAALQKTLGWLEMAEREGGLSTWLEAWNDVQHATRAGRMGGDASGSWHDLAARIGNIHQGIEFCKEIIKDGLGTLVTDANFNSPLAALDAIGSEIARQADEIIAQGRTPDPAPLFDAIKERMKTLSERSMVAERMHTRLENGKLHEGLAAEIPDTIQQDNPTQLHDLKVYVDYWQDKAGELQECIDQVGGGGDANTLATEIYNATEKAMKTLTTLIQKSWSPTKDLPVEEISLSLHVYGRLAEEMAARLDELSKQIDMTPRKQLQTAARTLREKKELAAGKEPDRSIIHQCRTYAQQGQLADFWGNARATVDKALRTQTDPGYVPGLADKFAEATHEGLEDVLSSWTNRNNPTFLGTMAGKLAKLGFKNLKEANPTDVTYTLSWELIAIVRNLKRRSETVLANRPQQLESITRSLDSIIEVVSEELQQASLSAAA
jgi:hypothetical protein